MKNEDTELIQAIKEIGKILGSGYLRWQRMRRGEEIPVQGAGEEAETPEESLPTAPVHKGLAGSGAQSVNV